MKTNEPFSQSALNGIFKISPKRPDCVNSIESSNLEFKKSFNWGSAAKYARTFAAFANTKGGYVVFGIANKPHKLTGLKKKYLSSFENIDPEKVSGFLNEHFSPEIQWDIHIYELAGKHFGLLYAYESLQKPVMCIKDFGSEIKEGDIYYRYRGRTTRIKYPELQIILDLRRKEEQHLWLKHLTKIARIGVRDAGIFDLHTGEASGASGSFLIDETLLSQVSFIKEGEFSEVKGKPTLKFIGKVKPISSAMPAIIGKKQIVKSKGIRVGDIVLAFLEQKKVMEPREYIKQICFESTAFLPVYYFMHLAKLNKGNTIEMVEDVISRSMAKSKLLERLRDGTTQSLSLPLTNTSSAIAKQNLAQQIFKKEIDENLIGRDLIYCLQAIRSIAQDNIKRYSGYIRDLLKIWFNKYYSSGDGTLVDNLRRAICWIDEALYRKHEV